MAGFGMRYAVEVVEVEGMVIAVVGLEEAVSVELLGWV